MKVLAVYFSLMIAQLSVRLNIRLDSLKVLSILQIHNFQTALKCNFRYNEIDKNHPETEISNLVDKSMQVRMSNANINALPFECDDDESLTMRIDDADDDDSGNEESLCETRTKTIRPKSLPLTSNNHMVTIVNSGEFIQTVTIEECM